MERFVTNLIMGALLVFLLAAAFKITLPFIIVYFVIKAIVKACKNNYHGDHFNYPMS